MLWPLLWSSPFLFLGAFMLSEPLTLPPRRWQQLTVAAVVGVLAGWPIDLGDDHASGRSGRCSSATSSRSRSRCAPRCGSRSSRAPSLTPTRAGARPSARTAGSAFVPGPVPRARGAAPPPRRPRHPPRVQHRLGPRGPAAPARRVPRGRRTKPQSSYKKALAEVTAGRRARRHRRLGRLPPAQARRRARC